MSLVGIQDYFLSINTEHSTGRGIFSGMKGLIFLSDVVVNRAYSVSTKTTSHHVTSYTLINSSLCIHRVMGHDIVEVGKDHDLEVEKGDLVSLNVMSPLFLEHILQAL